MSLIKMRLYFPALIVVLILSLGQVNLLQTQDAEATEAVEAPTAFPEPTDTPTEVPTSTPLPTMTDEATPTETEAALPTAVITEEATTVVETGIPTEPGLSDEDLTPTATTTPLVDPETGKSLELVVVDLGIAALAAEDLFANAHPIISVPFADVDDTTGSGVETGETSPSCGFNITSTVWYAFTPPAAGRYIISTAGSHFDTMLAVYQGSNLADLVEVACNDDVTRADLTSSITLNLTNTETLYIQLGGYNGNYGLYQLQVQAVGVVIPQPPTLALPTNNTLTNNNQLSLAWNPPLRGVVPDYYRLQVASDARFLNIVEDHILAGDMTSLTLNGVGDGLYFWRVAAQNINRQESRFTAVWRFTVDTTPPDAPLLSAPVHESAFPQVRPRLVWLRTLTANRYRIEIARDPAFSDLIPLNNAESAANAIALSAAVTPDPLAQGVYYWRVYARDAALNWSAPSASATFTVNLSNTPVNGQVYVAAARTGTANVTVTWLAAGFSGAQYTVELATDAGFTNIVATSPTIPQLRYAFTELEPNIYYWRVLVNGTPPLVSSERRFSVSPPAPPRLIPTGPVNNYLTNGGDVLLNWNGTDPDLNGGPFTYEVQVSTNARFLADTLTVHQQGNGSPEQPLTGLADGIYFWRVRAVNQFDSPGAWSAVWRFTVDTTPPLAPVLAAPRLDIRVNTAQPTLVWQVAASANQYRVEVADHPTFDGALIVQQELAARQVRLPVLAQGVYYWRVAARDAAGNWGAFSAPFTFTFGLQAAPANDLFSVNQRPVFTWAVMPDAQRYRLQMYQQSDLNTPYLEFVTMDARTRSYRLTENLPYGAYAWRVDVDTGEGWQDSPVMAAFTITPRALVRPALTGPTHNYFTNETQPVFTWNNVNDPDENPVRYEINISDNARFTTFITGNPVIVSDTSYMPTSALADGRYYWRVRAINIYDGPGAWSVSQIINIDTVAPPVPVLRSPLNATVSINPRQPFVWNPAVGAQRYEIRLGVENPPETLNSTLAARQYVPPAPLLYTTYYWQVRAIDAAGNVSDWTPVQTLKLEANTNQRLTLNRFDTPTPALSWSAISWATAYELVVANNTRFTTPHYQNNTIDPHERSHTVTTPLTNGTYYWRVRAQRSTGAWGAWSSVGTFTVESQGVGHE